MGWRAVASGFALICFAITDGGAGAIHPCSPANRNTGYDGDSSGGRDASGRNRYPGSGEYGGSSCGVLYPCGRVCSS